MSVTAGNILISTAFGPYEPNVFFDSATDVMGQRFSKGCGMFTLTGHMHMSFGHVIAQNIQPPTVVLEYPRRQDFIDELSRDYDVVAIGLFHNQVEEVIEMCKMVRQMSPESTIVLGGYGAVGIEAVYPEAEWKRFADHICHEDGIGYMRRLLGEPEDGPISITHLPKCSMTLPWLNKHAQGNVGTVVASVGCPKGCDFCGTTEMFKKTRHALQSPKQVADEVKRYFRENHDLLSVIILEEDSFAQKEYLMEIGRLLREDEEAEGLSRLNFYMLGGIESMDQWTFDEILLTGCIASFIGVESKFAAEHGYKKRRGRSIDEVFHELHLRGISTTGAWMAGFDFQNRRNIEEDLQEYVGLEPTFQQLTRACPFPATQMWKEMCAAKRLAPRETDWRKVTFVGGGGLKAKNFEEHEVSAIIDRGYRLLYETWGPSLARRLKVDLNGYEYCINHSDIHLSRDRSRLHKRNAAQVYPIMKAIEVFAPNGLVRRRMRDIRQRYQRLIGPPTPGQSILEQAILKLAQLERARDTFYPREARIKTEPYKRHVYGRAHQQGQRPYTTDHPHRDLNYEAYDLVARTASKVGRNAAVAIDFIRSALSGKKPDPVIADGMLRGPF